VEKTLTLTHPKLQIIPVTEVLKPDHNKDVNSELVSLVPINVLLVPKQLTIVSFVPPEELKPHYVDVQTVNMPTKPTSAEIVTSNVKLVPLSPSVLNVLKNQTDFTQKNVHVNKDTMNLILLSVHLVMTNVLLVLPMNNVSPVLIQESTHLPVTVQNKCMMTLVFVRIVLINVTDVTLLEPIVNIVVKTELMPQLVTVHLIIMMMDIKPIVQNVTVNVILVILLAV